MSSKKEQLLASIKKYHVFIICMLILLLCVEITKNYNLNTELDQMYIDQGRNRFIESLPKLDTAN